MPKKKTRSYGDYIGKIDGKLYAIVRLPQGNGKYKKKVKLLSLLGDSKNEAKKWALHELEKHQNGELEGNKTISFSRLAQWYKKEFLIPPIYKDGKRIMGVRTYEHQKQLLTRLEETFGLYNLEKMTVDVFRSYKRKRLKDVSVTTINREFALIRTMFKKAKIRKWIKESPFELGESLIEVSLESSRKIKLNDRIAKRLLARSRKSEQTLLHYLILVAMHTGARPSEVYPFRAKKDDNVLREPLCWKNILDYDYKAVLLVSYKGRIRKERMVPTSPELERGLRKFHDEVNPKDEKDLLFPITSIKRSWGTLVKSVKCQGVWFRDFRHYYNSKILTNKNFNDMERMLLLGQTRLETNLRYSHLDEKFIEKYRSSTLAPVIEIESEKPN